jgi:hypothetical protein
VENDAALDNEAAEGFDLVSEHLCFCSESCCLRRGTSKIVETEVNFISVKKCLF